MFWKLNQILKKIIVSEELRSIGSKYPNIADT